MKNKLRINQLNMTLVATMILFIGLFSVGSLRYTGFFSLQVFLNLFIDNAFLIIVATGMVFVIISGGIDLSVGSVIALTTLVCAALLKKGVNPIVVILLVLIMGFLFGLAQGYVIQRFKLHPWIVTLAGLFLARGLCYLISVESIDINNKLFENISQYKIPLGGQYNVSISVIISLVFVLGAMYIGKYTEFGRTVYAIGGNEQSAILMGLPVERTKIFIYAISGFSSALSGLVFSFYMLSGYGLHALGMEMDAIAACVIGGVLLTGGYGFIIGPMFGVLSMGVIQTIIMFEGTLSSWWTRIVIGILLFIFIVLQRVIVVQKERNTTLIKRKAVKI
ncbi:galactofuranose ABC transporter, permease protein YjfF [Neobacillus cucumis]|uniref:galactofuranose ABC transporter, permease protein YjfF n=1 Tax=Neobacillus cucumis TaxID=1740721 RepID=UPI002E1DED50|nr:galactofuranose ABC transporter, permease protein YjfF [Neobacillus cucumis]MED4229104.1 sugar ABC transporter permease YjfF [Neobacillus cucumis]